MEWRLVSLLACFKSNSTMTNIRIGWVNQSALYTYRNILCLTNSIWRDSMHDRKVRVQSDKYWEKAGAKKSLKIHTYNILQQRKSDYLIAINFHFFFFFESNWIVVFHFIRKHRSVKGCLSFTQTKYEGRRAREQFSNHLLFISFILSWMKNC